MARRLAATALGLGIGAVALPVLSPPADAVGVFVGASWTTPVTWVDDAGRQYVTVRSGSANGDGWPSLRIARDLADGTPDASWGSVGGTAGVAEVAFEPPAAGLLMGTNVAAADDGTLSVAWREASCAVEGCWRWFSRHDGATGARIGAAVDRGSGVALTRQLDDGSWLGHDGGTLVRVDGTGASLGAPALAPDDVVAADPTASGDLLTIDLTATLRRTPAGGGADDLVVATGCSTAYAGTSQGGFAVGAAPDGGFAVACRPAAGGPLGVTSYDAAGAAEWTTPKTSPEIGLSDPDRATVDADGRVWVAGRGGGFTAGTPLPVVSLASFTAVGDEMTDYARPTLHLNPTYTDLGGTGVTDLRTVGDDHVALADLQVCCRYPNNTTMALSVFGQTFPKAPGPPRCIGPQPVLANPTATSIEVTFEACNHQQVERRPTSYRVEADGPAGTAQETVAHVEGMGPPTVALHGLDPARLATVRVVPANDLGDTSGYLRQNQTILPFATVDDFFGQIVQDLWNRYIHGAEAIGTLTGLKSGELTPADFLETSATYGEPAATIAPLARIYRAYFQRDADPQGLAYWVGRRRAGWTVQRISQHFSGSSEFLRTYGSLSDRQFVALVYQNVLGRPADPGGADYWTRKLQRGTPRGTVMAQFSEGSEFVRTSNPYVRPLVLSVAMLGRPPTADERDRWALEADPYATIPSEILGTEEYRIRIAG